MTTARILKPAAQDYRGNLTTPARWDDWVPRQGDVLVCTPPKCGTTWMQTMVHMLLQGRAELSDGLYVVSPWVDAALGRQAEVKASLAARTGRRVVKTHTPADGFPVWEGVTLIAVYRHPLDLFFSLRKHVANMAHVEDHVMKQPVDDALRHYLHADENLDDWDNDSLAHVCRHFEQTCLTGRWPALARFHYSDMVADHRGTVVRLAGLLGCDDDTVLIDAVVQATAFASMKSEAAKFVPEGDSGFWNDEKAFFDSGQSGKWENRLTQAQKDDYQETLKKRLPDPSVRGWIEFGSASNTY